MTLVHKLTLPSHLQAGSFEEFARTRYLPALHLGQTRAGQLSEARLLRDGNDFILISEWDGLDNNLPRVRDEAVVKLFEAYRADITLLGEFTEVGRRQKGMES